MQRLLLLLIILTFFNSCKDDVVDPSQRVRPVRLQISVSDANYKLSWEGIRFVCITAPCPDIADVEAEEYEIQITNEELGTFHTYKTVSADVKSIDIPVAGQGEQLVARIVSKAKGVPPVNSIAVMETAGFLSQSLFYPGFGTSDYVQGGDVTPDGSKTTYWETTDNGPGKAVISLYTADMQYERPVSSKLISQSGGLSKFSDDGKQIAYLSSINHELTIYDIATEVSRTIPLQNEASIFGLAWSPDGKWLAYNTSSDESSRLWKISTSGGSAIPLTPVLSNRESNYIRQADIDWSPDSKYIALSSAQGANTTDNWRAAVSLYSPDGNGEVKAFETQPGWIDTNPSFSPDGKQMAFLSTRTDPSAATYSLWVRDLATGKSKRIELLPNLIPSDDYVPHWLGNERLLFLGTQEGKRGYFSVFL